MTIGVLEIGFALWLVASAVNQFDWQRWRQIASLDVFGLIPCWTFFAPRPGTDDLRLVYRDVLQNGSHGAWREIETMPEPNPFVRMFWNPGKLDSKALCDLVQMLAHHAQDTEQSPTATLVTLPYVQLLDSVMRFPRAPSATARQFALLKTHGHVAPRETAVVMLSRPHLFEAA
jgi:hypothetical protein